MKSIAKNFLAASFLLFSGTTTPALCGTLGPLAAYVSVAFTSLNHERQNVQDDFRALSLSRAFVLEDQAETAAAEHKFAKAEGLYMDALQAWIDASGAQSEDVGDCLARISAFYAEAKKWEQAKKYCQRSLDVLEPNLKVGWGTIAVSYNNLGYIETQLKDYNAAKASLEQAVSILTAAFGKGNVLLGLTLNNVAELQMEQGNYKAAVETYEESIVNLEDNFGERAEPLKMPLRRYAEALRKVGRPALAKKMDARANQIQ